MFINEWTWLFDFVFTPPTRNYLMRQYDMIGFPRNEHFSGRLFPNRSRGGGRERGRGWAGVVVCNEKQQKHWKSQIECGVAQQQYPLWWRLNEEYFSQSSCGSFLLLHSSATALWMRSYYHYYYCCCCCHHGPFPLASLSFNKHKCYTYFYSQNTSNSMYTHVFILKAIFTCSYLKRKCRTNQLKRCVDCALEQLNSLHWGESAHTNNRRSLNFLIFARFLLLLLLLSACVYFAVQTVSFIISFVHWVCQYDTWWVFS